MPVELSCDLKRASRYIRLLREEAAILMRLIGREDCELSILLTGDRQVKRLNSYYRFRNQPTDVLSFSQLENDDGAFAPKPGEYRPPDANLMGDVVISLDTASRQAREMSQSVGRRLRTLLVHGVLHLLGYDHERSKTDAASMFGYQDRLEDMLDEAVKAMETAAGQAP